MDAVLYVLLAFAGHTSTALFVLFAFVIISFYGGGFSAAPAYLRDLFGTLEAGAIHGRLLTAAAYQPALLIMVGLLVVGFVANLLIKPVDVRSHEAEPVPATTAQEN